MVKMRTLYIFEGPDTVTITKGSALEGERLKNIKIKQRGFFGRVIPVVNLEDIYIGASKKLRVTDSILSGWEVIKIKKDFLTHESFIPDVSPRIIAKMQTLQNELKIMTNKYYGEKKKNLDRTGRDRFKESVKDEFKFAGEARQLLLTASEQGWGGGLGSGGGGYSSFYRPSLGFGGSGE